MSEENLMEEVALEESAFTLSSLSYPAGARHRRKRLGIGEGSGNGKTCGKGQKGQRMRCGFRLPAGFEGGQMPLHRRLPKVGFTSRKKVTGKNVFALVSVGSLLELDIKGDLTIEQLLASGLIRSKKEKVKLLGGSEVTKALVVECHAVSVSAKEAIEKAGGQVRLLK